MFAVIKTGGKQYRVSVGDVLEVERIPGEVGSVIDFKEVLLIDDGEQTWLGQPYLPKAVVRAELLEEFKGDKVIVFKKKRRKQYKKKRGHRQIQSRIKILEIIPNIDLKEKETPEIKPSVEAAKEQPEAAEKVITAPPEKVEPGEKEAKAKEMPIEGEKKKGKGRQKKAPES